jgi:hypothetical protein
MVIATFAFAIAAVVEGAAPPDAWPLRERCAMVQTILHLARHSEIDGSPGVPIVETACGRRQATAEDGVPVVFASIGGRTPPKALFSAGESCEGFIPLSTPNMTPAIRSKISSPGFARVELTPWARRRGVQPNLLTIAEFSVFVALNSGSTTCGAERGIVVWENASSWRHVELFRDGNLVPPPRAGVGPERKPPAPAGDRDRGRTGPGDGR